MAAIQKDTENRRKLIMTDVELSGSELDSLHYEDYGPHLNSMFIAQFEETTALEIELIAAEEKPSSPRQERFVLVFRAPVDAPIRQRLYELRHEKLGRGTLFLVPTGKDEKGVYYEAVFNRRRPAQP
jgi:hypothetical protein